MSFAEDIGFNAKIFKCIDKALGTLGRGVKESFYYQIQEKHNLPIEQFPTHPLELIEHLKQILGENGSLIVEKLIAKEIRVEFGLEFESKEKLSVVIQDARSKFLNVADSNFQ